MTGSVWPVSVSTDDIDLTTILVPLSSVFFINFLGYLLAIKIKDNSIIDTHWGLTFIYPNLLFIILRGSEAFTPRVMIVFALVCTWGIRLAWHIGARHKKEDFRYQDMRRRWTERSEAYFYWASFIYVWMMQGLFSLIVNSSAMYVCLFSQGD
jgi:steroid 5-alpha reductase family enzyme